MLDQLDLKNVLFLDIETVPQYPSFDEAPPAIRSLWEKKVFSFLKNEDTPDSMYRRAGIYAEFGKIICISAGCFTLDGKFRVKSWFGKDEREVLQSFAETLKKFCSGPEKLLCAHNGKEFDFPYMARRMLILGIKLPAVLDTAGKKPWEVNHLDTMELWKFGDYKSFTSLALLAEVFDIPTPKDDIDGSRVAEVFWIEDNLDRIATYCQKDVLTIAQILRKFRGEELIPATQIEFAAEGVY